MCSLFTKPTLRDNMYTVHIHDGAQSVGTEDGCLSLEDVFQLLGDGLLRVCIQVTRHLIEEEDLGVFLQETTCN